MPSLPTISEPHRAAPVSDQENSALFDKTPVARQPHELKQSFPSGKTESSTSRPFGHETAADAVKTGDDIIEFYGKYGQDSPIKFFYCNR